MRTQSTTLGEVFALIPGILGFYPQDSVVILTLEPAADGEGHTIGPVLRFNLEHAAEDTVGEQLAEMLGDTDATHALVLFVSDTLPLPPNGKSIDMEGTFASLYTAGRALEKKLLPCDVDVVGMWVTQAVTTGNRFRRLRYLGNRYCVTIQTTDWDHGRIGNVATAPSMRMLIDHGLTPALSRQECFDAYAIDTTVLGEDGIDTLASRAEARADEICEQADEAMANSAFAYSLTDYLDEWVKALFTVIDHDLTVEDIMGREELLEIAICACCNTLLRDIIMGTITTDWAEAGIRLLTATARTVDGISRANALTMVALYDCVTGSRVRMMPTLSLAADAVPGHRLSSLATDCVRRGLFNQLSDACVQASYKILDLYCPNFRKHLRWKMPPRPDCRDN